MTVREAYVEGYIENGVRVRIFDLDGPYSGIVHAMVDCLGNSHVFSVRRDDGQTGGGKDSTWAVAYDFGADIIFEDAEHMTRKKKALKKKDKPVTMADLEKVILPVAVKEDILSVLRQHDKRDVLLKDWGLDEIVKYGLGMTFLFHGPPGTGKTYIAKLIAEAMGKELHVVSPAELESQVPGEFERQTKAMFERAKRDKEVLFFDECDSLVQSRAGMGQIMSGQNNCLLTELEHHDGIVFLATNRIDTLDEALERRISLIIEFKMPTKEERLKIWERHLPKKMPLGKDVSVAELAEYKLSGGQIKNAVLNAARFAVGRESEKVEKLDFERSVARIFEGKEAFKKKPKEKYLVQQDILRTNH